MGMYDTITCEYPLPIDRQGLNKKQYQTKSLGNDLETYHIRPDGSLWRQEYVRIDADAFLWTAIPYDGEITFYDFYDPEDKQSWVEFKADFLNGQLQQIQLAKVVYPRKAHK